MWPSDGTQLFAASKAAKKQLVLVDGAGHSNIAWTTSFNDVQQAVHSFFGIGTAEAATR